MGNHNIHTVSTYKDHNTLYSNKDISRKKNTIPSDEQKIIDDPLKRTSSPATPHYVGTKVAFSIERDLHIVVTTVKDSNTDTVIRQIPPEETIKRLKLLNNSYKQPIVNAVKSST
jgi:uncharacterized FlaG/YvyC family protein